MRKHRNLGQWEEPAQKGKDVQISVFYITTRRSGGERNVVGRSVVAGEILCRK
jgi:hypothetical protein